MWIWIWKIIFVIYLGLYGCEGGSGIPEAFECIHNISGIDTEAAYPYDAVIIGWLSLFNSFN